MWYVHNILLQQKALYFYQEGNLHIHSRFDHSFIKHIVIRFIWYFRYEHFLGDSPSQKLNYIIALASAATHCVLLEQQMMTPLVDPFMGLVHYNKFIEILEILDNLEGEDKIALENFKLDILEVGPSQMRTVVEGDDDDVIM
jgi:hypothetical protein